VLVQPFPAVPEGLVELHEHARPDRVSPKEVSPPQRVLAEEGEETVAAGGEGRELGHRQKRQDVQQHFFREHEEEARLFQGGEGSRPVLQLLNFLVQRRHHQAQAALLVGHVLSEVPLLQFALANPPPPPSKALLSGRSESLGKQPALL